MVEAGRGRASAFRALVPRHGERVERVQVSEDSLYALASEENNARSSEYSGVPITAGRRSAADFGFDPARAVDVEHVGVVEVREAGLLSFVEVAAKDDERGSSQGGRVAAAGSWGYAFNLRERPEPFAFSYGEGWLASGKTYCLRAAARTVVSRSLPGWGLC